MHDGHAVVIGDLEVARRACTGLRASFGRVTHVLAPSDDELRALFAGRVDCVAVLVRGDVHALRYALLVEHLRPGVRLVVAVFDRTVSTQLVRAVPNCVVTSPADVAAPSLVGALLGPPYLAVGATVDGVTHLLCADPAGGVVETTRRLRPHPLRRAARTVRGQVRPSDVTTRILLVGSVGLAALLGLDWLLSVVALHEPAARALFAATRVVATVGAADPGRAAPTWYLVFGAVSMLVTIGLTAMFTAGVVNRLHSQRSVSLVGGRTAPTHGHVIVVGLGQVGLRLCLRLREIGMPVVAVERDPHAANLRLAKRAKIPVLVAHGEDRDVLERLRIGRARAIAAVGADDIDNVEVAIAALAVAPDTRVVLRAGESDVLTETQALFPIGHVCDVSALTAHAVVLDLLGEPWQTIVPVDGRVTSWPRPASAASAVGPRCLCAVAARAG